MAVTFPTDLSRGVDVAGVEEDLAFDPSLKSQFEDGEIQSRARFTTTKKKWQFYYSNLTVADKALLIAMQDSAMVGANTITWTCPIDSLSYTVRLETSMKFSVMPENKTLFRTSIVFIEA